MTIETLIYIAYKTCDSLGEGKVDGSFQYSRAKTLIAMYIIAHYIQIMLIIKYVKNERFDWSTEVMYITYLISGLIVFFLVSMVFNKETLFKSLRLYNRSSLKDYARLIGLGYLFGNILVVILLYLKYKAKVYAM